MMNNSSQRPVRPAINRGATAPIYQRRQQHDTTADDPSLRLPGITELSRIDESGSIPSSGAATTDTVRRTLGASEVTATTSSRPMLSPALVPSSSASFSASLAPTAAPTPSTTTTTTSTSATPAQGLFTPPQTPAVYHPFSRPSSGMPTPRVIDSERSPASTYFPMSSYQPAVQHQRHPHQRHPSQPPQPEPPRALLPEEEESLPPSWTPMAPSVSAASSSSITPSQLRRQSPQAEIKMEIETSPTSHTLLAPLGNKFTSDAITIAAKKNNVLQIMADRWDQEQDSHFEWLVTLDRDADMSKITAAFVDGLLRVTVRRRELSSMCGGGRGPYRVLAGYP